MRFDSRSAAVLRKASRGPAAIALRLSRARHAAPVSNVARVLTGMAGPLVLPTGLGCLCGPSCQCEPAGLGSLGATGKAIPAKWQVDPTALRQLITKVSAPPAVAATQAPTPAPVRIAPTNLSTRVTALRSTRLMGFGSLGFSPTAGQAVGTVGSKAGAVGASTLASELGASAAVAGPIGIAAGVVIALAVSLFSKQYFNVGASNQLCQQLETLWQKYTTIQGYVAGRALGWKTMNQLMHAATGAGLFPGNDMHLSFHEGTLQCAGHGDWVDAFTGYTAQGNVGGSCGAHNCMPDALKKFNHGSVPAGVPDAIYFVDAIVLPMNDPNHAKIPWIYNGATKSAQVRQLLYDLADAYLAQFSSGTVPYVRYPQNQIGTPTPGAIAAPATALPAPSQLVPAQTASTPSSQNMQPVPGGTAVTPVTDAGYALPPLPGVPATTSYYMTPGGGLSTTPTPGSTPVPAGYTGAATVGGGSLSMTTMISLGAGLVALALLLPKEKGKRR